MKKFLSAATALMLILGAGPVVASEPAPAQAMKVQQQYTFLEGVHYRVVNPDAKVTTPKVAEYFSLACSNCYTMDTDYLPHILPGLAEGVVFEQKHVNFANDQRGRDIVTSLAIMQELGVEKQLKPVMFEQLGATGHGHHQGEAIQRLPQIREVFLQHGVSAEDFDKAASSETVRNKLNSWASEQQKFLIDHVPSFVVNDKFQVLWDEIQNLDELVSLLNYLAARK